MTDRNHLKSHSLAPGLAMITLLGALILLISVGARQSFGLFLTPLSEKLALGRESFAFSIALANLFWGVCAPFTGRFADRHGPLWVLVFGAFVFAAGFAGLGFVTGNPGLIICGCLLGVGLGATGFTVVMGVIGRAASEDTRDRALTIASLGSAVGLFLTIPLIGGLMDGPFGKLSIETVLLVVAVGVLLIALLAAPFARLANDDAVPSRVSGAVSAAAPPDGGQDYLRHSLQNRSFLLLMAGFFVCGFHIALTAVHLPAFLEDATGTKGPGVNALMLIGLGNIFGTYLAGRLGALYPKQTILSLLYLARAGIFSGFFLLPPEPMTVYVLSFLMGLSWLGTIPLTSGLVAELYGVKWLSMLFGVVFFAHQLGSFFGSWLGGLVFDLTKAYDLMWLIAALLALASAALHLPIQNKLQMAEPVE